MECRLQLKETPWQCQVSLRFETDASGHRIKKMSESEFGPVLNDPAGVETMIRRAQLAILNPSVDASRFLALTDSDMDAFGGAAPFGLVEQLKFSSNVVCLNVSGPRLANLSFVDLPGPFARLVQD